MPVNDQAFREAWAAEREQARQDLERLQETTDRYHRALRRIKAGDHEHWSRVAAEALVPSKPSRV